VPKLLNLMVDVHLLPILAPIHRMLSNRITSNHRRNPPRIDDAEELV